MSAYLATIGLVVLFIVDYVAIIVWLMQTTGNDHHRIRFSMRSLFALVTVAAVHLGVFAAFVAELSPPRH
jgi:predicted transcriptional regulator